MKKEEFLNDLQDVLQREDICNEYDDLMSYDEWDSLSKMAVMAYFDQKFGIKIDLKKLAEIKKVQDLISIAGDHIQ